MLIVGKVFNKKCTNFEINFKYNCNIMLNNFVNKNSKCKNQMCLCFIQTYKHKHRMVSKKIYKFRKKAFFIGIIVENIIFRLNKGICYRLSKNSCIIKNLLCLYDKIEYKLLIVSNGYSLLNIREQNFIYYLINKLTNVTIAQLVSCNLSI
ncbi:hypothetical protein (nucleomorph) [Guillardia theta]|uniref:Uncharacterized protein n=1 Tax=Guillardia theta TaxID=55529 RepID=Q98S34_GUITH|nr:hypothetical protein GTHECHR3163 [Guillardia theta]AAK39799.1 hypothetical protein [Guillardia theta]